MTPASTRVPPHRGGRNRYVLPAPPGPDGGRARGDGAGVTVSCYASIRSPIGDLLALSDGTSLIRLRLPGERLGPRPDPSWRSGPDAVIDAAAAQLSMYFAGELRSFDLPLAPTGTAFQRQVWTALRSIPYGSTASYRQIAEAIGNPAATRAVGTANARNPLPIIVPCHRVIGADGSLTGYAGGLDTKRYLLTLEAALLV
jgi:methylated-DNA-[protein]-cysteine S-methyltransferase